MRIRVIICFLFLGISLLKAQQSFDNATRSTYLLDISKYVKWNNPEFPTAKYFTIGVLSTSNDFFWELTNMAKTRQKIQDKPILVLYFKKIEDVDDVNVLFVSQKDDYKLSDLQKHIKGKHVLLVTENFDFRKTMINFVLVNGKPKFEANEEAMKAEGLTVSQLFLAQAIKTREEWELLFRKTEEELVKEKETVKQQNDLIEQQSKQISEQENEIKAQKDRLLQLNDEIKIKEKALLQKSFVLDQKINEIAVQEVSIKKQQAILAEQNTQIQLKDSDIQLKNSEIERKEKIINDKDIVLSEKIKLLEKQRIIISFVVVFVILLFFVVYFMYRSYRIKKQANIQLEKKNKLILQQKHEIQEQRDVARLQRDQIAFQKQHITDSIEYAKRIQTALLPSLELFADNVENFALYKPKDIVSGDFYWTYKTEDELIVVLSDCTGHGVPGAFMSMLGITLLNEIVIDKNITQPDLVLNMLRERLLQSLCQNESMEMKDGMDVTVSSIHFNTHKLYFAGANLPLYLFLSGKLLKVKGDKMPVGNYSVMKPFTLNEFDLSEGDSFFSFSDGYADQFGGLEGRKFMSLNITKMLVEINDLPMIQQGVRINDTFENWKGSKEQVDDVTVIGLRFGTRKE
jgi:serine phosphatase RsbU (regulator of sigma subunit)